MRIKYTAVARVVGDCWVSGGGTKYTKYTPASTGAANCAYTKYKYKYRIYTSLARNYHLCLGTSGVCTEHVHKADWAVIDPFVQINRD